MGGWVRTGGVHIGRNEVWVATNRVVQTAVTRGVGPQTSLHVKSSDQRYGNREHVKRFHLNLKMDKLSSSFVSSLKGLQYVYWSSTVSPATPVGEGSGGGTGRPRGHGKSGRQRVSPHVPLVQSMKKKTWIESKSPRLRDFF